MVLTIETLFNDPSVIKAVIDRVQQTKLDTIYWKRYLTFEQTLSRTFKTYLGTVTGVRMGSVIGKNSNKPVRQRKSLGSGYGEVAFLGDRFQMDNDRLDMLKSLIDKFNQAKTADQSAAMNDIINYVTDDLRQVMLAPHKRMDYIVGQLRSTGKGQVKNADNPKGIELIDITLPLLSYTPAADDKTNFITYLKQKYSEFKTKYGVYSVMEMTESTFNNYILKSSEFTNTYKMILSDSETALAGGLITSDMANRVLGGIGIPAIRIVDEYVEDVDGNAISTFADKRITFLQQDQIGKMMWHEPYEISDPIPGKTYTRSEGGMFISQQRDNEGRYMEYGAEWIPNISAPQKLVNFDLKNF